MYGRGCRLGCLQGSVMRIGAGLVGQANRQGTGLSGTVMITGGRLAGSVSLVCSVGKDAYLKATPEVVWLTPDMISSAEFYIYTNLRWTIY